MKFSRVLSVDRRLAAALAWGLALVLSAGPTFGEESSSASADGGAPWGVQLAPGAVPLLPRKPAVPAKSPAAYATVPATPASSWSPNRGLTAPSTGATQAATPLQGDAVWLEALDQAAPPTIEPVSLNEQNVAPTNEILAEPQPKLPPGTRNGVFQKIYLNGSYLPALSDAADAVGWTDVDFGVVLGFPLLRRDTPLLVTPYFGYHALDNAAAVDLPATLYDAAVEFRHLRKFGDGPWAMDAAVTVGYYSDFDQGDADALRVTGRAIGVYESSPQTKWLLGVVYLNRAGASVLPAVGVIHEPSPDLRYELIFPRPKIAKRIGMNGERDQRWVYLGGEFGGGVWSVTRPTSGLADLVSYSDWRLLIGYERKIIGGLSRRFEFGYVFNREIEYEIGTPDAELDDTLFARAGLTF